jgi:hypothetical protein
MSDEKTGTRARLLKETKTMLLVFVYLALLLGAFTAYRRLVLAEYGIGYFHYGCSILEALVLAKAIVFGSVLGLGERFSRRPLIVPTLYKAVCFSVLVLVLAVLERLGSGWWYGKNFGAELEGIVGPGLWEILARVLVLFTALVPLFAVWETVRLVGEGKLFELFFKRRTGVKLDMTSESTIDSPA